MLYVNGRTIYGRTENEVYDLKDQILADAEAEALARLNPTVRDYGDKWIKVSKKGVTDRVYDSYAAQLTKLYSVIGDKKVKDVTPLDIKEAFNLYIGKSQSLIHLARMLWISLFDAAIAEGFIHINPVRQSAAAPHKGTAGSHRAITQAERDLIWAVQHPMRLMALVMLYCGLRRGEALGINLDTDYDREAGVITVARAIRYESNAPIVADPKTEAGERTIPVPAILAAELKGRTGLLYQSQRPAQAETETEEKAGPPYASEQAFMRGWESWLNALSREANGGIPRRWWGKTKEHKALLAAGGQLPEYKEIRIRAHDLRHSYCTMLRDAGIDIHVAMQWMGHADEKMILRIYDHTEDRIRSSIDKLAAFTGGTDPAEAKEIS